MAKSSTPAGNVASSPAQPDLEGYPFDEQDGGYCYYQFLRGNWELKRNACADSYKPSPPPVEPGTYERQISRQVCVMDVAAHEETRGKK